MDLQPGGHARHRPGRWLPHQDALEDWLEGLVQEVRDKTDGVTLHPVIEEFRELIERDPVVRMYLTQMVEQVPHAKRYTKRHLESVDQMLLLINEVIGRAPEYNETGLVGVPLNAVLDWCMGTPAGFAAFRYGPINAMLRKILKAWCAFLSSPESLYVINDSPRGWKCASARKSTMIEQFQHEPREEHWGFTSWNDYFTRRFKPGERPIADPEDDKVDRQRLRIDAVCAQDERQARGPVLDQGPALFVEGHARQRRNGRAVRRRHGVPGIPRRPQLSSLAQPGDGHDPQGVRPGGDLLLRGRVGRRGPSRARRNPRDISRTSRRGRSS